MSEQQIRDALTELAAAAGPVDERAAWQSVQARIDRDRRTRRVRTTVAVAGLALAGAAAAVALVVVAGDDRQAVDVGPADSTVAPVGGLPERPLAVVVEVDGRHRLDLYDADTGEMLTRALAESVHSISDVSITDDGTVAYTEELGDSSVVRTASWDRSSAPVTPYELEESESSAPTYSPDGTRFAFVRQGITIPRPSIVVVDTDTGEQWSVEAEAPIQTIRSLAFSPSGARLFFTADGQPWVMDTTAEAPTNARPLDDGTDGFVVDGHFAGDFEVIVLTDAPEFAAATIDGPGPVQLPPADGIVAFDVNREGTMALVHQDGTLTLAAQLGRGDERTISTEGDAVDVGW